MTKRDAITAIMTTDPTTIERTQPISEAYQLLRDAPFHHLVVTEGDEPVGVLATSDILRLVYDVDGSDDRALRTYIDHQFAIDDAMTTDMRTLTPSATVKDAATILSDGSFHSVVVLAGDGKLAGIVTTTDLARYLRDKL
ncbi:MAG: CBS domain-containing protein [Acidimicrobiia bacterium]|nr:CBS domain-containing protein [Acidimicrobiia bacterium]